MKASAPTKVILFGEHYVVYGAPALSVAVDVRRQVEFSSIGGEERIEVENPVYKEDGAIFPDGSSKGHRFMEALAAVYKHVHNNAEGIRGKAFRISLVGGRIFKGMGASSAICASLAKGLYEIAGKNVDDEEIFRCAQIGDEIDHGGRPSGIDARTVVHGGVIKFWREFNPSKFNYRHVGVALPRDTTMFIVDTFRGTRCNTGDQVVKFAEMHGIEKKPDEMSPEERERVTAPYARVYGLALNELNEDGNAEMLGELMNECHALLRDNGMSTPAIEEAIKVILESGGLGAKITGAGGDGGAILGYLWKKDMEMIAQALKERGFEVLELRPTNEGVKTDS